MSKKLLYLSNRIFWPPIGGHEMEVYHYCRGLHDEYGYLIDVYAFDTKEKLNNNPAPEFLNDIILASDISYPTKLCNLIFKSLFGEKWPLQNSLYYNKENVKRIYELLDKKKYDVVIVDMIRLATYYDAIKEFDCKKVLDIDDTLSKRYKRQLKAISDKTDIAGQYNDKLPGPFQKILRSSFIKKMVLNIEIPRMENAEKRYSELFDNVIFVSPIETDEFNRRYYTNKAVTISLGVDYTFFSENIEVKKEPGKVTFIGNMATPANADSVRWIIEEVLPKCKNLSQALFVGKCPPELIEEYKNNKNVSFTGKVDDLRKYVKSGMVFLAPLSYGTGIKTKILEAMAMGMPVVTNSVGAEGIAAVHGKHWYVSDDTAEMAFFVDKLLDSQELCDQIGEEAMNFVKEFYQWDVVFKQFEKLGL